MDKHRTPTFETAYILTPDGSLKVSNNSLKVSNGSLKVFDGPLRVSGGSLSVFTEDLVCLLLSLLSFVDSNIFYYYHRSVREHFLHHHQHQQQRLIIIIHYVLVIRAWWIIPLPRHYGTTMEPRLWWLVLPMGLLILSLLLATCTSVMGLFLHGSR